jgi:hypothetical protein
MTRFRIQPVLYIYVYIRLSLYSSVYDFLNMLSGSNRRGQG